MTGLDPSIVAAIEAGRTVVVADPHRATALRLAWARASLARGARVWRTPDILTFSAWLERAWRGAASPAVAGRHVLTRSQQRAVWESALAGLDPGRGDATALEDFAAALMPAAERAVQWLLPLARSAVTDEERLLVAALQAVRQACGARGWVALPLLAPDEWPDSMAGPAPLFAGLPSLSPWQQALAQRLGWQQETLLAGDPPQRAQVRRHAADGPAAELQSCAAWCRRQLAQQPVRRLLVVSAYRESGLADQAQDLWRALAAAGPELPDADRARWLAVEGGEPLRDTGLVGDALQALALLEERVETRALLQVIASPYFDWGDLAARVALQDWLGQVGLAHWRAGALRDALQAVAERVPVAVRLGEWLAAGEQLLRGAGRQRAVVWAERASQWLAQAGFAVAAPLGSADQQRLQRWSALLDELAMLDAVQGALGFGAMRARLGQLAGQAQHQPATGDAAITFSGSLQDPVCDYDGIWVLGLAESRWPEAPRPDPFIALAEQRRSGWAEAGARERRLAAHWVLQRWQARTGELWLSHALREGDLPTRPNVLLAPFAPASAVAAADLPPAAPVAQLESVDDRHWPPLAGTGPAVPLRRALDRLQRQQECGFRAQAEARCGARALAELADGMPVRLRGRLLHALLQRVWQALGSQHALRALAPEAEQALVAREWAEVLQELAAEGVRWLPAAVLDRERERSLRIVGRLLALDRDRPEFQVESLEREVRWDAPDARLDLRIDRLDRAADGGRVLIDYKSGEPGTLALHDGRAEPLQLAVYAAALAAQGEPVATLAVASLKPARLRYQGVSGAAHSLPGRRMQVLDDVPGLQAAWTAEVLQLLRQHLAGEASLATTMASCRHCHLATLCRRMAVEAADESPDHEDTGEEVDGG